MSSKGEATVFQFWPGAQNEQVDANSFSSTGEGMAKEMGLLFSSSVSQRNSSFFFGIKKSSVKLSLVFRRPKIILDLAIFLIFRASTSKYFAQEN